MVRPLKQKGLDERTIMINIKVSVEAGQEDTRRQVLMDLELLQGQQRLVKLQATKIIRFLDKR